MARSPRTPPKDNEKAIEDAIRLIGRQPLLMGLMGLASIQRKQADQVFPQDGFARIVVAEGYDWRHRNANPPRFSYACRIVANPWQRLTPEEWTNVLAQALLHIALNHVDPRRTDLPWRLACELQATDMLRQMGAGQRPADLAWCDLPLPGRNLEAMARTIEEGGATAVQAYGGLGLAGRDQPTWVHDGKLPPFDERQRKEHTDALAAALRRSIMAAVDTAGGLARGQGTRKRNPNSLAERARSWCIASYPLLAALAAAFEIVEDEEICERADIRIAAVNPELRQIYVNPRFPWTWEGMQFVMAHELLHVGLAHAARRQGRDPWLWNVACDYVINGWLIEMGVGVPPTDSLMLDIELGLGRESAEAVYDRIVKDLRLMRRLGKFVTLRGTGKGDILGEQPPAWWRGAGMDLDSFYRRALADGLDLHCSAPGRGLLPGDLVEEIRALQHPPIPWDVKLGQWLDAFIPPLERRRSFARASRRQSATPDIPRPVYLRPPEATVTRTFGVVLDTSGSMPSGLIGRAVGAIASYAMSREVALVRIVQCDAGPHDMGWVEPEQLLQRVEVKGRGGTILRPGIDKLERADDFPRDAPILVITDGMCDGFTVGRAHAFLMPEGARLPFRTSAPVFHFERT